ncbi:cytochrome c oxidase assembly protein [Saccharopolyspora sp. NPDC002686]|uniref:cytochrome c oxidase assembly protein n=1 Tax=Saccharopolyspora sp. NPDC002686 TaxID=3154541 RepID=UPI00332A9BAF
MVLAETPELPPELTPDRIFTSWTPDPAALVVVAVLGTAYWLGVRRLRAGGESWSTARTAAFFGGLATIALVTMSFLGVYADALFWARAVQNTTLLMIAPLLLAIGAPLSLLVRSAPQQLAERTTTCIRSKPAQLLTFPGVVTALLVGVPFALYLTPLYELTLRSSVIDAAMRGMLVFAGFVYFWTRLRVDPTPRDDPHVVSFGISLAEVIFDGVLGLVLWLGPLRAPHYYEALARTWGPSLRTDQIIAAGVVWIGGDLAGLPFLGALMRQWKRDDAQEAAEIDRTLDAQEEEQPDEPAASSGLWWEDDPILAERFRR